MMAESFRLQREFESLKAGDQPGTDSFLDERPGSSNPQTGCFHVVTTGLSQRLLDFVADGGDRICVDHLVDFLALSDHHEVQVYRRKRIPGDDDYG
jgi:hypothetical protein